MQTPSQPPQSTIGISDLVEDDILDIVEDILSSGSVGTGRGAGRGKRGGIRNGCGCVGDRVCIECAHTARVGGPSQRRRVAAREALSSVRTC